MSDLVLTVTVPEMGAVFGLLRDLVQATERLSSAIEVSNARLETRVDVVQTLDDRWLDNHGLGDLVNAAIEASPEPCVPKVHLCAAKVQRETAVWTQDRKAVLRMGYPTGVPVDALFEQINALPGAPVARKRIAIQAAKMGLSRPVRTDAPAPVAGPEPVAPISALAAALLNEFDVVTYATALKWAGERGLAGDAVMKMDVVNAKRRVLGLKPFKIEGR